MQFTIPGYANPTIVQLKEFCSNNGIVPTGNKTIKQNWMDAIDTWHELEQEAIALAVDAEKESQEIAASIEVAVVSVGSLVVASLTSETAIAIYRGILKGIVLAVVLVWMLTIGSAKWLWSHRKDAAVWHWVSDWLDSESGRSVVTHALIFEWVLGEWVESIGQWSDGLRDRVAHGCDRALARLGLAGVAIEV